EPAILVDERVFSTGHAVHTCLNRLGWPVEPTSRVPMVRPRPRNEPMVHLSVFLRARRFGKPVERVPHCDPRLEPIRLWEFAFPGASRLRKLAFFPVLARRLNPQQGFATMRRFGETVHRQIAPRCDYEDPTSVLRHAEVRRF